MGFLVRVSVAVAVSGATLLAVPVTSGRPPMPVTSKMVTVSTGGRSFPARLVYPTDGGPYPAVAFAHGYGIQARQDHQLFVDLFRNGRIPGL